MNNINRSCLCDAGGFWFLVLLAAKQLDTKSISSLKKRKDLKDLRDPRDLKVLRDLVKISQRLVEKKS